MPSQATGALFLTFPPFCVTSPLDMFWINEKLGIALELTEAGFMAFDIKSSDFNMLTTPELREKFFSSDFKISNADEAEDFARSKLAEQAKES